ncbi:MAG: TetR/AcrR family transcriptional regulator [Chloroflexi bacterium]|nr:TetR/AcrR family transcriptional regulator [Chloroflexota bacterium]
MRSARERIIETTCELLELQGYHATGLNQIIKESGSPKGSLYHYFPGGKEELVADALSRDGQIILNRIRDSLALVEDPAEAVRQFVLNIAQHVQASGYRSGGPITAVAMETAATNERLRAECKHIYEAWQGAFVEKLVSGGISEDRASRLASLILAALEGGIILSRTNRSPQPLEDIAGELGLMISSAR